MKYSINRTTLLLIILVFLPAVIPMGTNGINLIEIIAFVCMPFSIGYFLFYRKIVNKNFFLIVLFLISITFSYIYGALILGRGFIEPLTMYVGILKILSFYFLGYLVSKKNTLEIVQNNSKYFFWILVIFGIVQIYTMIGKEIIDIFYHSDYWNVLQYEQGSVSFYHPVNFIYGLIIFGMFSLIKNEFLTINKNSIMIIFAILYFAISASVLTIIGGFILFLFFYYKSNLKYIVSAVIGFVFIWIFFNFDLSYELIELRKFALGFFSGEYSLNDFLLFNYALSVRFEHTLLDGWNTFTNNYIIGIGPGGSMDSFYVDLLASYGLIGFFIFFYILFYTVYRENKINKIIVFIILLFILFSTFQKPFIAGKAAEIFWFFLGILDKTYKWRIQNVQLCKS
jgi:hypothetical protein